MQELSTGDFRFDVEEIMNEYKNMRMMEIEEDNVKRIDQMIIACETVNGKSFEEILNLVDTGVFNPIISAYCKRVMREVGVSDDKIDKALEKLEEIYEEPAEDVAIAELQIEVNEGSEA